jgi:uncharacterized protein YoaH (UPF0181 family)
MTNNKQQTAVEWLIDQMFKQGYFDGNKPLTFTNLDHLQQQAKEMEREQELRLIKFTSEIFELGKSNFSYALITNEEILELYNETKKLTNDT